MRYFITLSYNGTNYSGWQTQPSAVTVQETIERALGVILRSPTPIPIVGAGRTDAGVHARAMVAHVDLPLELEEAKDLVFRADRFLPKDIACTVFVLSGKRHMHASVPQHVPTGTI